MFNELAIVVFFERDSQFILCVHHDGSIPGHRLTDWSARYEEKSDGVTLCRDHHLVAVPKEDQAAVAYERVCLHVKIIGPLDLVGKRFLFIAEATFAVDYVSEYGVASLGRSE